MNNREISSENTLETDSRVVRTLQIYYNVYKRGMTLEHNDLKEIGYGLGFV